MVLLDTTPQVIYYRLMIEQSIKGVRVHRRVGLGERYRQDRDQTGYELPRSGASRVSTHSHTVWSMGSIPISAFFFGCEMVSMRLAVM